MGTKYQSSTATQTPPSYLQDAYKAILGNAQGTASSGFTPFTGGFTPAQQTGIANIGSTFAPTVNALNAAQTPTYASVGNYLSPYNQAVIQATTANQNNQNAEQQQQVVGDAIAKGAYGGNRVGVAQGELARQQDLANQQTIAGLYNQNYSQALGAAQNQQQVGLGAAQGYGTAALNEGQGLFGAGTQQQQFNYSQYLNQQAFPYAQQSWLSSLAGGLGGVAGGTTVQQQPQGNIFSELLGAGLGAASRFNRGGTVRPHAALGGTMPYANDNGQWPSYASGFGGMPYVNDNTSFPSYMPQVAVGGMRGDFPTIQDQSQPKSLLDQFPNAMKTGATNIKDWFSAPQPMDLGLGVGGSGGASRPEVSGLFAAGGVARRGYADRGRPSAQDIDAWYSGIIDPNGGLVGDNPIPPVPVKDNSVLNGDRLGLGLGNGSAPDVMAYAPTPTPANGNLDTRGLSLPPIYSTPPPTSGGTVPYSTGDQFMTMPTLNPATGKPYSQNIGDAFSSLTSGNGLNLDPDMRQSLLAAGLGMMASKSPFALQGIGEGGLAGIETWNARQALERANAQARSSNAMTGAQIATQAQTALLLHAQTADANTTYTATPFGMQKTTINPDGSKDVSIVPLDQIPGGSPTGSQPSTGAPPFGNAPSGGATPTPNGPAIAAQPVAPSGPAGVPKLSLSDYPTAVVQDLTGGALKDAQAQGQTNIIQPAVQSAASARTVDTTFGQLTDLIRKLPASGPLVLGAGFNDRTALANTFNTALQSFGIAPVGADDVATAEDIKKIATQLNLATADAASKDPGIGTIMHSAAASPSGDNTRLGVAQIVGNLLAMNKRIEDRASYVTSFAGNNRGLTQSKNATVDDYFNAAHPVQSYVDYGNAMTAALAGTPITPAQYGLLPSGAAFFDGTSWRRKP